MPDQTTIIARRTKGRREGLVENAPANRHYYGRQMRVKAHNVAAIDEQIQANFAVVVVGKIVSMIMIMMMIIIQMIMFRHHPILDAKQLGRRTVATIRKTT